MLLVQSYQQGCHKNEWSCGSSSIRLACIGGKLCSGPVLTPVSQLPAPDFRMLNSPRPSLCVPACRRGRHSPAARSATRVAPLQGWLAARGAVRSAEPFNRIGWEDRGSLELGAEPSDLLILLSAAEKTRRSPVPVPAEGVLLTAQSRDPIHSPQLPRLQPKP